MSQNESVLTPRQIQAQLRAGASVSEVARQAGVSEEQIDSFAGPILAEREYAVSLAKKYQLRRQGQLTSSQKLEETVEHALEEKNIDPESAHWDSKCDLDRNWIVEVTWFEPPSQEALNEGATELDVQRITAQFDFNRSGRFCVPHNQAARDLIDDATLGAARRKDPDSEPTIDLHDPASISDDIYDRSIHAPVVLPDESNGFVQLVQRKHGAITAGLDPQDYAPAHLEQVDGIYDIVPDYDNNLDVLYEMLSDLNEDSVRIYTGLTQGDDDLDIDLDTDLSSPESQQISNSNVINIADGTKPSDTHVVKDHNKEAQQPEDALAENTTSLRKHKKTRSKRASVPSWDEIIFGPPENN